MTHEFDPATAVLKISGSLQIDEIEQLRDPLWQCILNQAEVSLDLGAVDRCDTAALQVLFSGQKTALSLGKPFRVVEASAVVTLNASALGLAFESTTQKGGSLA